MSLDHWTVLPTYLRQLRERGKHEAADAVGRFLAPSEIQTMIEERADGTWEGTVFVGGEREATETGPSYGFVTARIWSHVDYLKRQRAAALGDTHPPT